MLQARAEGLPLLEILMKSERDLTKLAITLAAAALFSGGCPSDSASNADTGSAESTGSANTTDADPTSGGGETTNAVTTSGPSDDDETGSTGTPDPTTGDPTTGPGPTGSTTDSDDCGACPPDATCSAGECICNDGFAGDGAECQDIDECDRGLDDCSADASCTNTDGGFECACDPGFDGDGVECEDVDECAVQPGACSDFATCTNLPGSFECDCNEGFEGDGVECLGTAEYGEFCEIPEECGSGICLLDPFNVCTTLCDQSVPNDCANLGAAGFCIPISAEMDEFICLGDIETGFDGDDEILSVGDTVTRFMDNLTDVDMFHLNVPAGDVLIIATPQQADDDIQLDVYDALGDLIGSLNNAGPGGTEGTLLTSGAAGVSFAVVRNVGTSTGPYTMSLAPAP